MANKKKIINDPVLGFISIPSDFIYDLIQHPYFQRLNRIRQLGLASFVYPGTQHTRFLHSLGAMHLTQQAITQLRTKDHNISEEEENGVLAAILLHDIGHSPFSHSLENLLAAEIGHEEITLLLMQRMNEQLDGKLNTAIAIFTNQYPKKYLHQLISGQLDMDRLDYLIRDSFFSGVVEGTVGAERIIKMLNVKDDNLVIESKGINSVENFLIARRLMYWQVYLHKTTIAAEKMLVNILSRAKELSLQGEDLFASPAFSFFLKNKITAADFTINDLAINHFVAMDDADILSAIKVWTNHPDKLLSMLSQGFINRRLFKINISDAAFDEKESLQIKQNLQQKFALTEAGNAYLFAEGRIHSSTYNPSAENIRILYNDGTVKEIGEASDILNTNMLSERTTKYYRCYWV